MSLELYGCVCGQTFDNKPASLLDCCREKGIKHSPHNEPWAVVLDALGYQAEGEPMPSEEFGDAVVEAASLLAAAALVQGGRSLDKVAADFDRPYSVKLTYEKRAGEDGEIGIQIIWEDGEVLSVGKDN